MPVTAKLSHRFYDKLGEGIANQLVEWFDQVDATYRADLRELNELNFARFDARLEQRLAELRGEFRTELALQGAKLDVLAAELRRGMADLRAELLRWAFLFWVTTLGALYAFSR